MKENIRWYNQIKKRECTYIETLAAELKCRNHWINKQKWIEIEKMLPTITEEEAMNQCFIIRDTIKSEIQYHQTLYE